MGVFTPIIPLEYDASYSYIQRLMALCDKLNEQGVSINTIQDFIENLNIDEKIKSEVIKTFAEQDNLRPLLTHRKICVIGDSYTEGQGVSNAERFITLLQKHFDLFDYNTAGGGFVASGVNGTFETLLDKAQMQLDVTDVIFLGGINDAVVMNGADNNALNNAINVTVNKAHVKYPNAQVHVGYISQRNEPDNPVIKILQTVNAYRTNCNNSNYSYITNAEYMLKDTSCISADNIHPNAKGHQKIANYLNSYLTNGNISTFAYYSKLSVDMTSTPFVNPTTPAFEMLNDNGICTLSLLAGYSARIDNIDFTLDGGYSHSIYLGTPAISTIFGLNDNNNLPSCQATIPVTLSTNEQSYNLTGSLFIYNRGIFINVNALANQGEWLNLKLVQINIPKFTVQFNSLYC